MGELRLRLYDTLSASPRLLVPARPGEVRVYCCGPTTYDVAHVGHARAALTPDILVRYLRVQGLRVTYARNITDVDDKILKRAAESGEEPTALSARMAALYQEDMAALGCLTPDVEPRVSEHVSDIIAMIEKLITAGSAYVADMKSGARDVYYAVRTFAEYGKLSKRNVEDLRVGARIEASEDKRDPLDFALWKGCVDDAWGWDSPWGKGRPGWHIECSAMSSRYLGHGFDVHAGGMDLIFPHHENEIAQSEAIPGAEGPFARIWIHNGFVNVDKEKMAKSLGNFVTIRDVYARNDPEALRYFLLTVHYRGPIAFETDKLESGRVVFQGVLEAERRVDYLYQTLERLDDLAGRPREALGKGPKELISFMQLAKGAATRVEAALDDDLNTPAALVVVAELAKAGNELCDLAQRRRKDAALTGAAPEPAEALAAALRSALGTLGLIQTPVDVYVARTRERRLRQIGKTPEAIEAQVAARMAARKAKDFAASDAIRDALLADGIEVADSDMGTTWRIAP